MTGGLTITRDVHFRRGRGTRKVLEAGKPKTPESPGHVPRISRLMALAIHMQELVDRGEVTDYAELAQLAHVTRARLTQIMNLLHLAPDIQEEILFLPRVTSGRDPISERDLRPICAMLDWNTQRRTWRKPRRRGQGRPGDQMG